MPSDDLKVKLGNHEYTVVPQPYAYLRHQLKRFLSGLTDINTDATDLLGLLGENAYDLLAILIPGLMPRFEFEGFSTEQAYEDAVESEAEGGDPVEPNAPEGSPTVGEVLEAVNLAAKINRLDLIKHLKGLVGGDSGFLSALAKKAMADFVLSQTSGSSSSPPPTGTPTSSTTNGQSTESTDSDSLERGEPSEPEAEPALAGS